MAYPAQGYVLDERFNFEYAIKLLREADINGETKDKVSVAELRDFIIKEAQDEQFAVRERPLPPAQVRGISARVTVCPINSILCQLFCGDGFYAQSFIKLMAIGQMYANQITAEAFTVEEGQFYVNEGGIGPDSTKYPTAHVAPLMEAFRRCANAMDSTIDPHGTIQQLYALMEETTHMETWFMDPSVITPRQITSSIQNWNLFAAFVDMSEPNPVFPVATWQKLLDILRAVVLTFITSVSSTAVFDEGPPLQISFLLPSYQLTNPRLVNFTRSYQNLRQQYISWILRTVFIPFLERLRRFIVGNNARIARTTFAGEKKVAIPYFGDDREMKTNNTIQVVDKRGRANYDAYKYTLENHLLFGEDGRRPRMFTKTLVQNDDLSTFHVQIFNSFTDTIYGTNKNVTAAYDTMSALVAKYTPINYNTLIVESLDDYNRINLKTGDISQVAVWFLTEYSRPYVYFGVASLYLLDDTIIAYTVHTNVGRYHEGEKTFAFEECTAMHMFNILYSLQVCLDPEAFLTNGEMDKHEYTLDYRVWREALSQELKTCWRPLCDHYARRNVQDTPTVAMAEMKELMGAYPYTAIYKFEDVHTA
ncbi:hypothetical protein [Inachis io cypovirus 2]|uniref:Uncharacterized protein n=1 Tax=Inachis io cypovirus 2 TaxID=1382295 RepID=W6EJ15_9REOV|nr:hypothetical protein [Inachis io cypovirus 2]AHJ14796.1 hypothetical protein [Inachis io cypovirus 2]